MAVFNSLKLIRKHSCRGYLIISFLCFTGIIHLSAQKSYSKFEHLTINEGLLSNRIRCIFRDSKDYLWIGTDAGLNKYDSYQVVKYKYKEKQSGSISSDNTTCIYEDRDKNLWFGTDNGLNLYDPAKNSFTIFKNDPVDTNSINSNYVSSITEDKKGNLWIVTDGNCLNKWIPKAQKFIRYHYQSSKRILYSIPARMIASDSKGYFWVVSFGPGIFRFDPESGKFIKFINSSFDFGEDCYKSLYIDNKDKIWITTAGNGFFSYDPVTDKYEHFVSDGNGKGTNQSIVIDVFPEDDNHLLLAVDQGGLNRFDKVSKTFEYIRYDPTNDEGLNNDGIWCLFKDREGILWIGTSGGGVNFYNPKKEKFKLFRHNDKNPKSLSYNLTTFFFEDSKGLIWIGTDGGGVNVYDPLTGIFTIYKHTLSDPYSISGNTIRNIAEDKDSDIWIGSWDGGLCRFDRKTRRFFRFTPAEIKSTNNTILNLIMDHNKILWLCILNEGTVLLDKNKGVINRFRSDPNNPEAISSDQDMFFFEDSEKNMWICTSAGLNLYDTKHNSFKVIRFPENTIWAFYRDSLGNLWVGTNSSGLYYCKPDGTIIQTFNSENGLPDNSIRAITGDNNGNIWISSNHGISRLDGKTRKIRNYSKDDGLQSDQFLQQSFLKTSKGEIYFGGTNGFNSFYPDSLKNNNFIPQVYITDFQIFNKPVVYAVPGAQFQTHISEAKEIRLTWRQSVFSFSFAAINYTHSEKNQYAYIMEGFEKEWNYTDASRRYVMYTNLSPGKYVFHVKATNNDEVWNDKGVSLRIVILPPWWKMFWFKLIIFFAVFTILAFLYISRVQRLKNKKILLENQVAEKTSELQEKNTTLIKQAEDLNRSHHLLEERHQQIEELNASKDKFFSIIAHDLKNPFNTIIGFSQILKEEIRSGNLPDGEDFAIQINTTAVQTLRLLENLLDWANSQRGKMSFNPVPINFNELLQGEMIILNEMAIGKNIELKSYSTDNITIIADKNMLRTILRNLISNAIKFTHKNGKVEVSAMTDNKNVEISVSDNGIGIAKETRAKLFRIDANLSTRGTDNEKGTGLGLFLCKEFIEKHGGKIWVESESGKGSSFKFIIPLIIDPSS